MTHGSPAPNPVAEAELTPVTLVRCIGRLSVECMLLSVEVRRRGSGIGSGMGSGSGGDVRMLCVRERRLLWRIDRDEVRLFPPTSHTTNLVLCVSTVYYFAILLYFLFFAILLCC